MTELDKIGVGREKTEEKFRVALTRYEAGNKRTCRGWVIKDLVSYIRECGLYPEGKGKPSTASKLGSNSSVFWTEHSKLCGEMESKTG